MTNGIMGKVVGAVVDTGNGLVIVNVAGLNTPAAAPPAPKPLPTVKTAGAGGSSP